MAQAILTQVPTPNRRHPSTWVPRDAKAFGREDNESRQNSPRCSVAHFVGAQPDGQRPRSPDNPRTLHNRPRCQRCAAVQHFCACTAWYWPSPPPSSAKMERQRSHQAHQQSRARRVKKIEELEAENLRLSGGRRRDQDHGDLQMIPEADTGEAVPFARVAPAGSQDERPAAVPDSRSGPPGQQQPTREAELQRLLAEARRDAAGAQQREQDARLAHQ